MKRLIFLLFIGIIVCSCGSSNDDVQVVETANQISYNGEKISISKVAIGRKSIDIYAGDYMFTLDNCSFELNKKNYLSAFKISSSRIYLADKEEYIWGAYTSSSYISVFDNDEDNRKKIEIRVSDGNREFYANFIGITETKSEGGTTQDESLLILKKVEGTHEGELLFSENSYNSTEKHTTEATIKIVASDSSFSIKDFEVSRLSKYIKKDNISKAVSELPNQILKGKLLAYPGSTLSSPLFGTITNNITFQAEGERYTISFYEGYNGYSLAGLTKDSDGRNCFVLYITMGAIYKGNKIVDDALYKNSENNPFVCIFKYYI